MQSEGKAPDFLKTRCDLGDEILALALIEVQRLVPDHLMSHEFDKKAHDGQLDIKSIHFKIFLSFFFRLFSFCFMCYIQPI